jgi:ATPase subunit of ABC transporter with duplicated ATPase domains
VSHDRDFLTGLTTRLLELDDFRIRDQHMDILELIEKRKALQGADIGKSSAAKVKAPKGEKQSDQRDKRDRKRRSDAKAQNAVDRLEKQLADLEKGGEGSSSFTVMKGEVSLQTNLQKGLRALGRIGQTHCRCDGRVGDRFCFVGERRGLTSELLARPMSCR